MQETLARLLRRMKVDRTPSPSGRTDLGVHARMQVASVRISGERTLEEIVDAINREQPQVLGCARAAIADRSFHAQWSAAGKEYRYRIALDQARLSPEWEPFAWAPGRHPRLVGRPLLPERVTGLLQQAIGTRDFSAFHESSSPRKLRTLRSAQVVETAAGLHEIRLIGSGFGRYQVRYLVGTALAVAAGVIDVGSWEAALESAAPLPGLKAEARGLVLWSVEYPEAIDPFGPTARAQDEALPFWARVTP